MFFIWIKKLNWFSLYLDKYIWDSFKWKYEKVFISTPLLKGSIEINSFVSLISIIGFLIRKIYFDFCGFGTGLCAGFGAGFGTGFNNGGELSFISSTSTPSSFNEIISPFFNIFLFELLLSSLFKKYFFIYSSYNKPNSNIKSSMLNFSLLFSLIFMKP